MCSTKAITTVTMLSFEKNKTAITYIGIDGDKSPQYSMEWGLSIQSSPQC